MVRLLTTFPTYTLHAILAILYSLSSRTGTKPLIDPQNFYLFAVKQIKFLIRRTREMIAVRLRVIAGETHGALSAARVRF